VNVVIVPETTFVKWRKIARMVDLDFLSADDSPSSFGLHFSKCCQRFWKAVAQAVAMRDLEEAIGRRDGANLDFIK
jgi:hypothetical protein